jgi:AI-2 transport protein TqsA
MPPLTREQTRLVTFSLVVLSAAVITAALYYTKLVMVPFVLAIILVNLLAPGVDFLIKRLRFPKALAVFFAMLVALGILTLLGLLISISTRGLLVSAPIYQARLDAGFAKWLIFLDRYGLDVGARTLIDTVKALPLTNWLGSLAGAFFSWLTTALLVLIFMVYMMVGRRTLQDRVGLWGEVEQKIRRYIVTKVVTSAATGILVTVILLALGLDLAVVFGILAFFLNFIPNVGSVIAVLLPLPVVLMSPDISGTTALLAIAIPSAIQFGIGNGLAPKILGDLLDLHPVVILLALMFWGTLWGVIGMLLATPITASLKILFARLDSTRMLSEIMAGRLDSLQ